MTSRHAESFARAAARQTRSGRKVSWHRIAEIALLVLLAWLVARLVLSFLAPPSMTVASANMRTGQATEPAVDPAVLARFDPFVGREPDRAEADPQPRQATSETSLNLTLYGVWPDGNGHGSAIISSPSGGQEVFRVSEAVGEDEIMDGVALVEVHDDHVILSRNGVFESLYMSERLSPQPPAPRIVKSQQNRTTTADNFVDVVDAMTSFFSFEPHMTKDGRFQGYAVYPAGDSSAFLSVGLLSGDIITAINGRPAPNEPEALIDLLDSMTPNDPISLTLARGDAFTDVTIRITDLTE